MTPPPLRSDDDRSSAEVRFDRLYNDYRRHVVAYCRRRVGTDRVDDVVAETFLTAWRRIGDVPDDAAALLWLYRVAYRAVGHHWRSVSRRRRLDEKLASVRSPSASALPADAAEHDDEVRRVLRAAARLNDRDAEILRLLSWEQLSHAEIADVLDIAPNAVNQRLHRARTNLTKEFNRLEPVPVRSPAAREGGMP